jgi:hypothetical protein
LVLLSKTSLIQGDPEYYLILQNEQQRAGRIEDDQTFDLSNYTSSGGVRPILDPLISRRIIIQPGKAPVNLIFWKDKCHLPLAYNAFMPSIEEGIVDNRPGLSASDGSNDRAPQPVLTRSRVQSR